MQPFAKISASGASALTYISKKHLLFLLLTCLAVTGLWAQNYTTTGNSTNWDDTSAWLCEGGNCNRNPVPGNTIANSTVTIRHDMVYSGSNPITLRNRAVLIVERANFTILSNLKIDSGSLLQAFGAEIRIGPGILNVDGRAELTNSILEKDGNVVNNNEIVLANSCITLLSGNFNNNNNLLGVGGVRVLNGNAKNSGTWSLDISYYLASNGNGLPGSPSTLEEVEELCRCVISNCDIQWATDYVLVHDGKLSNALYILGRDGYDPTKEYNKFIYRIRVDGGVPKVLVQIVVGDGSGDYASLRAQLTSLGVQPADFVSDYDAGNLEDYITCYVPIANLLVLDTSPYLIQVLDGRLGLTNTGAVLSEGVAAMRANIARLGWDVTGEGVTIGVISDSFNSLLGYDSDKQSGDLPEGVAIVDGLGGDAGDLPPGEGSDEGRAMLQLVHDVAPGATLKFTTGFNGKYNFASKYAALAAAGCDIIIDDVQYIDEAMYRDDVVAQAVNNAVDAGAMVFTAAGNFGSKSIEQTFTATDPDNPTFHVWQGPGGGTTEQFLELDPGFYIIALQWEDQHASLGDAGGAQVDLNVYLGESPDILDFGSNVVNLGKDPMDFMYFLVLNPTTTNILVERGPGSSTAPVEFKYVVFRSGDTFEFKATPALNASTIVGHANAVNAFTTGAVRFDNLYNAQESSSRGGTETNGVDRQKPDAMGPTGGRTTVELGGIKLEPNQQGFNFFGTSAAAPHVGAVAAMLMEAGTKFEVDLTGSAELAPEVPLTVRNLLLNTAVNMGDPLVSGSGFVRADLALGAIASPTPELLDLNYEYLNPVPVPGEDAFVLRVEGNYFTDQSVVYFQGQALQTTFVDSQTLEVDIPPFIGSGDTYVFTPSSPLTNGTDGGNSDTRNFYSVDKKTVIIKPNDITRYYGVEIAPDTHPELFGFTVEYYDEATGGFLPLSEQEQAIFSAVDENGKPLFPVRYKTTDQLDSGSEGTYFVLLEVDVDGTSTPNDPSDDVDPGLLELYNFNYDSEVSASNGEIQAGALIIEPIPVEISLGFTDTSSGVNELGIKTFIYGDPLPAVDYVFNYVDENGDLIPIDPDIALAYETAHKNTFKLVNTFVLVNGGSFKLVNGEPETNGSFRLVNCTETTNGTFKLVNCEPEINSFKLVNQTFYVSEDALAQAQANTFKLVNNDMATQFVEINSDLFAQAYESATTNTFKLVNGTFNLVNTFKLVNGSTFKLVNTDGAEINGTFKLVNGLEFFDAESGLVNGSFKLVNGSTFKLVNGSFKLVNSDPEAGTFVPDTENSVVFLNGEEASEDGLDPPVKVYPVNGITGKDVGYQYIFTGRIFNDDFEATSKPTIVEIVPRPVEVITKDFPGEADAPVVYGDYGDAVPSGAVQPAFDYELATDLQYGESAEEVLAGIELYACPDCTDGKYPAGSYDILAKFDNLTSAKAGNYLFTQSTTSVGTFTVNPFELKVNLGDFTLTYGDALTADGEPYSITDAEGNALASLPYGELPGDLLTLAYDPTDACDIADPTLSVISAQASWVDPNYSVLEVADGDLTVNKAPLEVQVGTRFINQGDPIPSDFEVTASGWVCNDSGNPTASRFEVYDLDGNGPLTAPLAAGEYNVLAVFENPLGFELYDINQISDGKLYVNPSVGCNDRLKAADVCKTENVTLTGFGFVTTLVRFTVINDLDVPIYVPIGPKNKFKGNADYVIPGGHPELFMPGPTIIEVYTDGGGLQFEIISPGCNSASKSANGSNANPCAVNLEAGIDFDAQVLGIEEVQSMAYPNPATDFLNLFVGDQQGQIDVLVYDTSGRMLIAKDYGVTGLQEVQLDISALNPGFYFVKVGSAPAIQIIKQ